MKYSKILCQASKRIMRWKASSIWARARMALEMVKAHYDNTDIDMVTTSMPNMDEEGNKVDSDAIGVSLPVYNTRIAKLVNEDVFVPLEIIDNDPSTSESLKTIYFIDESQD